MVAAGTKWALDLEGFHSQCSNGGEVDCSVEKNTMRLGDSHCEAAFLTVNAHDDDTTTSGNGPERWERGLNARENIVMRIMYSCRRVCLLAWISTLR